MDVGHYNPKRMSRGLIIGLVVLVVLGGLVAWGVGINNELVTIDNQVQAAWAQVQNQYQRRADLIPNLVETVKGFAAQERGVLEAVTQARARRDRRAAHAEALNDPKAMEQFQAAQRSSRRPGPAPRHRRSSTRELKVEPELPRPADAARRHREPHRVERKRFNDAVAAYNTRLRLFPGSIVARLASFTPKAFFEAAPGAATPPPVKF